MARRYIYCLFSSMFFTASHSIRQCKPLNSFLFHAYLLKKLMRYVTARLSFFPFFPLYNNAMPFSQYVKIAVFHNITYRENGMSLRAVNERFQRPALCCALARAF